MVTHCSLGSWLVSEGLGIREASSMVGSEQPPLTEIGGSGTVLASPGLACRLMSSVRLDAPCRARPFFSFDPASRLFLCLQF